MSKKPDRITAMQQIIDAVKDEFPLYNEDTFKCGTDNSCIGCPKKVNGACRFRIVILAAPIESRNFAYI